MQAEQLERQQAAARGNPLLDLDALGKPTEADFNSAGTLNPAAPSMRTAACWLGAVGRCEFWAGGVAPSAFCLQPDCCTARFSVCVFGFRACAVKRRWDDDVVFKNQARDEPQMKARWDPSLFRLLLRAHHLCGMREACCVSALHVVPSNALLVCYRSASSTTRSAATSTSASSVRKHTRSTRCR